MRWWWAFLVVGCDGRKNDPDMDENESVPCVADDAVGWGRPLRVPETTNDWRLSVSHRDGLAIDRVEVGDIQADWEDDSWVVTLDPSSGASNGWKDLDLDGNYELNVYVFWGVGRTNLEGRFLLPYVAPPTSATVTLANGATTLVVPADVWTELALKTTGGAPGRPVTISAGSSVLGAWPAPATAATSVGVLLSSTVAEPRVHTARFGVKIPAGGAVVQVADGVASASVQVVAAEAPTVKASGAALAPGGSTTIVASATAGLTACTVTSDQPGVTLVPTAAVSTPLGRGPILYTLASPTTARLGSYAVVTCTDTLLQVGTVTVTLNPVAPAGPQVALAAGAALKAGEFRQGVAVAARGALLARCDLVSDDPGVGAPSWTSAAGAVLAPTALGVETAFFSLQGAPRRHTGTYATLTCLDTNGLSGQATVPLDGAAGPGPTIVLDAAPLTAGSARLGVVTAGLGADLDGCVGVGDQPGLTVVVRNGLGGTTGPFVGPAYLTLTSPATAVTGTQVEVVCTDTWGRSSSQVVPLAPGRPGPVIQLSGSTLGSGGAVVGVASAAAGLTLDRCDLVSSQPGLGGVFTDSAGATLAAARLGVTPAFVTITSPADASVGSLASLTCVDSAGGAQSVTLTLNPSAPLSLVVGPTVPSREDAPVPLPLRAAAPGLATVTVAGGWLAGDQSTQAITFSPAALSQVVDVAAPPGTHLVCIDGGVGAQSVVIQVARAPRIVGGESVVLAGEDTEWAIEPGDGARIATCAAVGVLDGVGVDWEGGDSLLAEDGAEPPGPDRPVLITVDAGAPQGVLVVTCVDDLGQSSVRSAQVGGDGACPAE
jgi:hypothetical protein